MMIRNIKTVIDFFLAIIIGFLWVNIVLASSYTVPFAFAHELTSVSRYFDGQNIAFEATPVTYPDSHYPDAKSENSIYTVTLKRDNPWPYPDDTIGTDTLPRTSFGRAVWTNVGPGNYFIFFQKFKDRMVIDDDQARLFNY